MGALMSVLMNLLEVANFGHCYRLAGTIIELVTYAAIPVSAFFMTIYGVRDLVLAVRAFLPKKAD